MCIFVAMTNMLDWSKGEKNQLFAQIFCKVAELNWMWEKVMEEFCNQVTCCICLKRVTVSAKTQRVRTTSNFFNF